MNTSPNRYMNASTDSCMNTLPHRYMNTSLDSQYEYIPSLIGTWIYPLSHMNIPLICIFIQSLTVLAEYMNTSLEVSYKSTTFPSPTHSTQTHLYPTIGILWIHDLTAIWIYPLIAIGIHLLIIYESQNLEQVWYRLNCLNI